MGETKLQARIPILLSPAAERRPYLSRAFQGAVLARATLSLIASQRDARTAAISPIHHAKSSKGIQNASLFQTKRPSKSPLT